MHQERVERYRMFVEEHRHKRLHNVNVAVKTNRTRRRSRHKTKDDRVDLVGRRVRSVCMLTHTYQHFHYPYHITYQIIIPQKAVTGWCVLKMI